MRQASYLLFTKHTTIGISLSHKKTHIQNILHPPSESTFVMLHKQIVILASCMTSFPRVKSASGLFSNNELFSTQESPSPIKTSDGDILRESMTNTKCIFSPRE